MQLVSTVTVGAGGAASIEFTNVPQSGTDLLVVFSGRSSTGGGAVALGLQVNSSATGYTTRQLTGDGSTVASNSYTSTTLGYAGFVPAASATGSTFGNVSVYVPNYSGSANKSFSSDSSTENNASFAYNSIHAITWASTNAITSLKLYPIAGTLDQYSSATIYTITKGSGGATVS